METTEIKTMTDAGVPEPLVWALYDAETKVERSKETLLEAAENIERKLAGVRESIERDGVVNSLGELQGRALDFDQECSRLGERRDSAKLLRHTCERIAAQEAAADADDELSGFGSSDGAGR